MEFCCCLTSIEELTRRLDRVAQPMSLDRVTRQEEKLL